MISIQFSNIFVPLKSQTSINFLGILLDWSMRSGGFYKVDENKWDMNLYSEPFTQILPSKPEVLCLIEFACVWFNPKASEVC